MTDAQIRSLALAVYFAVLVVVQAACIDSGLEFTSKSIWFYGGIASLLFGSHILNPYFTAPADSLANAFAAILTILPALPLVTSWTIDAWVLGILVILLTSVALASFLVLITRAPAGEEPARWWGIVDRAVKWWGSPKVIFSILIVTAAWLFHRDKPVEVFAILPTFVVILVVAPLEAFASFCMWVANRPKLVSGDRVVGTVAAHQSPGIVLVRQANSATVARGTALAISDKHGPQQLGVALNYVGRDEGNLLRVLTAAMPKALATLPQVPSASGGDGLALRIDITDEEKASIRALQWIDRLCGIVDSDTSPDFLQFEVVNDGGLSEGCLTEARIGDKQRVIYQVVDGVTRDEVVQQKNKYGYARAKARKIGAWDEDKGRFCPVAWMPRMNAPVFLLPQEQGEATEDRVGCFPATPYGVRVSIGEAVTHNTAILGILGVGKSFLAIELVERMIASGVKVVCLDLTNQYETQLADFVDPDHEEARRNDLIEAGKGGKSHQNQEQGGSKRAFKVAVFRKMREFLSADDDHFLWVLNPAQFQVTKQTTKDYGKGADLAHLTAAEITAIFSDAALHECQQLGMTDDARMCLVYEEAHSLVPEWNSVAAEGDRTATATSARAILQGRKYGLGCLLITQRTANVTKTILNQCNTIFAMRTFDDTGKDFLGNYIGSDYAAVLPSLQPRHAVIFGKASSCENPVMIRLNDQDDFRTRFRPNNPPRHPTKAAPEEAAQPAADADAMLPAESAEKGEG